MSLPWPASIFFNALSAAGIQLITRQRLNPQQHAVMTAAPGPLLVIAVAG
ncbi:MAG: hypothetical protein ABIR71_02900 [Chthoniobacterales bacterium]